MTFPYLNETEELTDAVRANAGGLFIQLSDGICHYDLHNTQHETRNPIVLIHGFSVPYFIWDPTFKFLSETRFRDRFKIKAGRDEENGFLRVLRYDLFGRGLSDRPRVLYDIHLFVRQLKELLDALGIKEPVHLAGLSMGGPISAAFVDQFPERIKSHILIDPAGAKPIPLSWTLKAAKLPLVAELALGLLGGESLVKGIASDFFSSDLIEQFQNNYRVQMHYKGFIRAILSTIRNGMLDSFYGTYQRVGALKKPTLLFWGRNDNTVPYEDSRAILSAIPHAQFHVIENCGHIPHYEKPEVFNPILRQFITSNL